MTVNKMLAILIGASMAHAVQARAADAPEDAKVYFISPQNGDKLTGAFVVRFGLRGMGVTHAGDATKNLGHHHLLVDVSTPLEPGEPIPADRKHLHFGAGQTETELSLQPGPHTLQLVLGDADHQPFKPNVASDVITVTVLPATESVRAKPVSRRKKRHGHRTGRA